MLDKHDLFDEFRKKYDKILNPVILELQKAGFTPDDIGKTLNDFIEQSFVKFKIESKVSTLVVDVTINAFAFGGIPVIQSQYQNVKSWLLKNNWIEGELNLSKTIHKNIEELKKEIGAIVNETLGNSVNWQKTAQKIYKLKDIKAELPKYMNSIIKEGKKVLEDPKLITQFNKKIKILEKQINKLSNLGYESPRLKKAYQNIIKQIRQGSKIGLDKGIERAIKAKTKYYAERIARTEIAEAYGNATLYKALKNKRMVGIRSVLSARHKILDICNVHANVNQYSMGKGVFPIKSLPRYPYHVQCMCSLIPVTENQIERTKTVNRMKQIDRFARDKKLKNKSGKIPFLSNEVMKIKVPKILKD